ncbi:MAG: hypothetical protein KatS3mg119_1793 [Rhodothalassiaceae bacterium]|nr:MAG: hypothetical protein KatS3mg119_1793 [Rhodothalassiaceae bacterium]
MPVRDPGAGVTNCAPESSPAGSTQGIQLLLVIRRLDRRIQRTAGTLKSGGIVAHGGWIRRFRGE